MVLYLFCRTNQQQKYTARSYPERTGKTLHFKYIFQKVPSTFPSQSKLNREQVTERSVTWTPGASYCPCTHFNCKINPFKTNKCTAFLISFTLHSKYPCVTLTSIIDTGPVLGSMLIFSQTDTQNEWGPWA